MVDAMEMSMPPVSNTNVTPMEAIIRYALSLNRLKNVENEKKLSYATDPAPNSTRNSTVVIAREMFLIRNVLFFPLVSLMPGSPPSGTGTAS